MAAAGTDEMELSVDGGVRVRKGSAGLLSSVKQGHNCAFNLCKALKIFMALREEAM